MVSETLRAITTVDIFVLSGFSFSWDDRARVAASDALSASNTDSQLEEVTKNKSLEFFLIVRLNIALIIALLGTEVNIKISLNKQIQVFVLYIYNITLTQPVKIY